MVARLTPSISAIAATVCWRLSCNCRATASFCGDIEEGRPPKRPRALAAARCKPPGRW
jgi:hypothetical protein